MQVFTAVPASYVLAGYYVKPWLQQAGYNSIYGNGTTSGTYSGKDVYNLNIGTTWAHKNYWGSSSGPSSSQFYGPVSTSYWLSYPPGPFGPLMALKTSPDAEMTKETFATSMTKSENTQANDEDTAIKKQLIAQFRATIAKRPGSQEAVQALQHLYSFVRTDWQNKLGKRSTITGYLNGLYNAHPNSKLGEIAHQLMIVTKMSEEEYDDAITLAEATSSQFSTETRRDNMVHLISLYLRTGQVQKAQSQFNSFKSTYPNNEIYKELLQDMLKSNPNSGLTKTATAASPQSVESESFKTESELPTNFALEQNYPNPFNPTTNISYQLPQEAFVNLTVYNLLGQKIRTLFKGPQNAGSHTLQWHGKNDFGESVSSGVYVVRMSVKGAEQQFVQSRKLAFVK